MGQLKIFMGVVMSTFKILMIGTLFIPSSLTAAYDDQQSEIDVAPIPLMRQSGRNDGRIIEALDEVSGNREQSVRSEILLPGSEERQTKALQRFWRKLRYITPGNIISVAQKVFKLDWTEANRFLDILQRQEKEIDGKQE